MLAGPMRQRTLSIALALLLLVTQQLGLLHLLSHLAPPAGHGVVLQAADRAPAHADTAGNDAADALCQACLVLATLGAATLPTLLRWVAPRAVFAAPARPALPPPATTAGVPYLARGPPAFLA
ncbi:MAG: hypothetical protein A3E25_17825 [Burkholderiales bacterium RIFCSPHIGHO2_12_FULL_69_20]|nr:MAG: hypothetical protein A3E25_17825 [Burkholderiales bacterium RIFCSPHIGHO2_12_FULL_69_20]